MKLLLKVAATMVFMAVFMAAIVAAARWAEGEPLAWWQAALAAALPLLIAAYLRWFSVIGCSGDRCRADRAPGRFPGP